MKIKILKDTVIKGKGKELHFSAGQELDASAPLADWLVANGSAEKMSMPPSVKIAHPMGEAKVSMKGNVNEN